MSYLVDANVLSEPTKPAPNPRVVHWLRTHEREFSIDAVILGKLFAGILCLPHGRKRHQLQQWFTSVIEAVDCLPWDSSVGLCWARLVFDLRAKGQTMPLLDGMIAATALTHDLTVVTRNVRDFKKAGVKLSTRLSDGSLHGTVSVRRKVQWEGWTGIPCERTFAVK